ncbi:MAG: universal stress protein [Bacillota bacterium]|nr:universal stress protein [Bacillota bacterium]MDW7728893.1 universal stress protein [Bacillota bacterium]
MYKILLATDGSDYSLESMRKIVPMAKAMQAEVTVITIAEEIPLLKGTEGMSKEELDALYNSINRETELGLERAKDMLSKAGLKVETKLKAGKPAETICDEAEKGSFNLVVLGDSGLGGLKELFLGSVSNKVVHQSKTDVMIIKRASG